MSRRKLLLDLGALSVIVGGAALIGVKHAAKLTARQDTIINVPNRVRHELHAGSRVGRTLDERIASRQAVTMVALTLTVG